MNITNSVLQLIIFSSSVLFGCGQPYEGPDKTVAGTVLGAAWGAGAGAVVGNQIEGTPVGPGAAIGAGFGAVSGAVGGLAYDSIEESHFEQEKQLAALKVQNAANSHQLNNIQNQLDQAITSDLSGGTQQIFFDNDSTSLRSGSLANLETLAEALKTRTKGFYVEVSGHSDDNGNKGYNDKISESRARAVSAFLISKGISSDQIKVESYGATRPLASNTTPEGRQLNRRVDINIASK
jgi:outer membrane protein OmpA-like peptidoglycan-associated protein